MKEASVGSLSKVDVSGRRTSTESEAFSVLIYLDTTKCVLLSIVTLIETNCQKIWEKLLPSNAKGQFRLTRVAQKRPCLTSLIFKGQKTEFRPYPKK